jgi:hypothetical protein
MTNKSTKKKTKKKEAKESLHLRPAESRTQTTSAKREAYCRLYDQATTQRVKEEEGEDGIIKED